MTAAAIWIILAVLVVVAFIGAIIWWGRTTGPSDHVDVIPSQPPAGAGAEGMRVPEPGEITSGPSDEEDESDRQ